MATDSIQSVFQKLEHNLVKVCSKQDAENVHRFRGAARRVQTLLEEVLPEPGRHHRKLLKALSRIRRRAGKVRDLDVQLAALRNLKIPQEPRRKSQLMNALIELRAEYEDKLCKALNKKTVREIRKRLKRAAKDLKSTTAGDVLSLARKMLGEAPDLESRGKLNEDLLHHYRIVSKRARYIAELAPPSSEATEFIAQLKRMQDAAGDWHDWFTLTRTAASRLGDVHESALVATLHNVTGTKFRNALTALFTLRSAQVPSKPARLRGTSNQSRKTTQPEAATAA
jgi:CHAD domain-containing protein